MIEVRSLTKYYGDFLAVEDLSFSVQKGEILGLLGSNGSGKTTTMRIIAGYLRPSSGTALVAGYDVRSRSMSVRRQVGYLPEMAPLYLDMTVIGYLLFVGQLHGMRGKHLTQRIEDVAGACRLNPYMATHIGKLSKGYRQRVGIAGAILHEPAVLILDEPTIGLDPAQLVETRELIRALGRNSTIMLSTHILAEVDALCDKLVILHEGTLVAAGSPADLAGRFSESEKIEVEIRGPSEQVRRALVGIPGVTHVSQRHLERDIHVYLVTTAVGCDVREQIGQIVLERKWALLRLTAVSMGVEEIFLRMSGEGRKRSLHA